MKCEIKTQCMHDKYIGLDLTTKKQTKCEMKLQCMVTKYTNSNACMQSVSKSEMKKIWGSK